MRPIIFVTILVCVAAATRVSRRVMPCTARVGCELCLNRATCLFIRDNASGQICIHRNDRKNYTIKSIASTVSACRSFLPDHPTRKPDSGNTPTIPLQEYHASPSSNPKTTAEPDMSVDFDPPSIHSVVDAIFSAPQIEVEMTEFTEIPRILAPKNDTKAHCDTAKYKPESWRDRMFRSMCRTAVLMTRHRSELSPEFISWLSWNPANGQEEMCRNLESNRLNKPFVST